MLKLAEAHLNDPLTKADKVDENAENAEACTRCVYGNSLGKSNGKQVRTSNTPSRARSKEARRMLK